MNIFIFISIFHPLICNLHIIGPLGDYEIDELTPLVLQKHVNDLMAHGNRKNGGALSANFVNGIITVIQSSLKRANELGYTSTYHAGAIQRPRAEESVVKCFTVKEQKAIEKTVLEAPKRKMLGVVIALYTGVRIGELLSLTCSAVDISRTLWTSLGYS